MPNYNINIHPDISEAKREFQNQTGHQYLSGTKVGYCNFATGPVHPPIIFVVSCTMPNYNINIHPDISEAKREFQNQTGHTPLSIFEFQYLSGTNVGYCNFATGPVHPPIIYIDPNWWRSASRNIRMRVAIHEMGHCEFGLLHQFDNFQIMYHTILDIPLSTFQWKKFLEFVDHCGDPMASINGRGHVPDRVEDMCLQ